MDNDKFIKIIALGVIGLREEEKSWVLFHFLFFEIKLVWAIF